MRKNYALIGIVAALTVGLVIVIIASQSGGSSTASTTGSPQTGATGLPPGHPTIKPGQGAATATPDYAAMVEQIKAKLDKDPQNPDLLSALANAYLLTEQFDKALGMYKKALALRPDDEKLTVDTAMAWHAVGNDERAVVMIAKVLDKNPDSQIAHYNMAIIYFSQENAAEAKAEWEKTAAIDPGTEIGKAAQNFVDLMENKTPAPTTSP